MIFLRTRADNTELAAYTACRNERFLFTQVAECLQQQNARGVHPLNAAVGARQANAVRGGEVVQHLAVARQRRRLLLRPRSPIPPAGWRAPQTRCHSPSAGDIQTSADTMRPPER